MHSHDLGRPCRNFNFLGGARFTDPRDGREKAVLSNFASGETGNLIFLDPDTGAAESLLLPGDEGAWAVLNLNDEKLLIGTCSLHGYLHVLDLKTRAWATPLKDPGENYIWQLCLGDDGLVYGGTYPGCVLLQYDPKRHTLKNLGRMSDVKENLYSRNVVAVPGHILVSCGFAKPHLTLWNLRDRTRKPFGPEGAAVKQVSSELLCLEHNGKLLFYDASAGGGLAELPGDRSAALPPAPKPAYPGFNWCIPLRNQRTLVARGQEYYCMTPGIAKPALKPIPADKPATDIFGLTADARGRIWGACGFGQTIFRYDPRTGEAWNSSQVCDKGGEVYGMVFQGNRLFMAAYSGGDHIVYDPDQPWDQVGNVNPKTLASVGDKLIRPEARSVIGPDGHVWTGWMAKYGVYGGGLSRVDVNTLEMKCWYDPIPGQAISGLTADDRRLYFVTSTGANGLPPREAPVHFGVWSPDGRLLRQEAFPAKSLTGKLLAVGGRVLVGVDKTLKLFNPDRMAFEGAIEWENAPTFLLRLKDDTVAVFEGQKAWRLNPASGEKTLLAEIPGAAHAAACAPDSTIYFASGSHLYRLEF